MTRVEVVPASLAKGRICARPLKTPKKGQVFHSLALGGCERSGGDAVVHCPISRMEKLSKHGYRWRRVHNLRGICEIPAHESGVAPPVTIAARSSAGAISTPMGLLNRRAGQGVVAADRGDDFAPKLALEGACKIVVVGRNFQKCVRPQNDFFTVICIQIEGLDEDRQSVDRDPQGPCPLPRCGCQGADIVAAIARNIDFQQPSGELVRGNEVNAEIYCPADAGEFADRIALERLHLGGKGQDSGRIAQQVPGDHVLFVDLLVPLEEGHGDTVMLPNEVDNFRVSKGLGDARNLQIVLHIVDRSRDVDGKNEFDRNRDLSLCGFGLQKPYDCRYGP